MNLSDLGWNTFHEKNFEAVRTGTSFPARVARAQREKYVLYGESGELKAEIRGNVRFEATSLSDFPVVGDWVVATMRPEGTAAVIERVLPRMNRLSRKTAGGVTDEQVLGANIDVVFIVNGLDGDFNVRRMERYLALARESGIQPVIVLNKADVCPDVDEKVQEAAAVAAGAPVVAVSAGTGAGMELVATYIAPGVTAAFLGSSGVGKSTIINWLMGEERQNVGAVRAHDSRGRHITTRREMILLPGKGILIDNPGLREIQLWIHEDTLDATFSDVSALAAQCRFADCAHGDEPGCAVRSAIESGQLESARFEGYLKLKKEMRYLATRKEAKARNEKVIWEKRISKDIKQLYAHRKKRWQA